MRTSNRWIRSGTIGSGLLVLLAGCYQGGTVEPVLCTKQFVYGLTVTVVDQSTSNPIAAAATMTLRDGSYEEVVTDSWDGSTLSGAGERPGTYTITIDHPGYETWTRVGVEISADECHVIPVTLTAELTPLP
ncbi:MAG: carboxypeptidase-like regulatory domain-containing protein [Longimicrobiales bacterium]